MFLPYLFIAIIAATLVIIANIRESKEIDLAVDGKDTGSHRVGRLAVIPMSLAVVGVILIVERLNIFTIIGIMLIGSGALLGLLILGVHYLFFLRSKHMRSHHFWPCAMLETIALLMCLICCIFAA